MKASVVLVAAFASYASLAHAAPVLVACSLDASPAACDSGLVHVNILNSVQRYQRAKKLPVVEQDIGGREQAAQDELRARTFIGDTEELAQSTVGGIDRLIDDVGQSTSEAITWKSVSERSSSAAPLPDGEQATSSRQSTASLSSSTDVRASRTTDRATSSADTTTIDPQALSEKKSHWLEGLSEETKTKIRAEYAVRAAQYRQRLKLPHKAKQLAKLQQTKRIISNRYQQSLRDNEDKRIARLQRLAENARRRRREKAGQKVTSSLEAEFSSPSIATSTRRKSTRLADSSASTGTTSSGLPGSSGPPLRLESALPSHPKRSRSRTWAVASDEE